MTDTATDINPDNVEHDIHRRFGGVERLYGRTALANFKQAHVIIIGIGGVGSWLLKRLREMRLAS